MRPLRLSKSRKLSGCEGKQSYPTMALAKARAESGDKSRNAYRCTHCGQYHLGNKGDDIAKANPRRKRLRLKGWQAEETIVRALCQSENS